MTSDSGHAVTLGSRLEGAERRRFVGRAAELELFRATLESEEPPFAVLFVHGPGGVGKTSLLRAFAREAAAGGTPTWQLDMRDVDGSPPTFLAALAHALSCADADEALALLATSDRRVLILDTYESVGPLDGWLRHNFLPSLGEQTIVVIAGREPPAVEWRGDPGWREMLRVVALRNLPPQASRSLLAAEGIAGATVERALAVTHGHPLALSLLVDVLRQQEEYTPGAELELDDAPDVVRALLERFVSEAPSALHQRALEVCAHVYVTTEELLRPVLGDDAPALFAWLRTLSFVEERRDGLFPHDLARDVLDFDLRWRDRAAYADIHRRLRRIVVERIRSTRRREQQRAVAELHHLHRGNRAIRGYYAWETLGSGYVDNIRDRSDREAVLTMVERHESPESAAIAELWLARQPHAFAVFRDMASPEPFGFCAFLDLHATTAEERAGDPGASAVWDYVMSHGAPRPGEEVACGRFFMDAEAYQSPPSRSFNCVAIASVQQWLSRPRLAWDFTGAWADPDAIAAFMAHIDHHTAHEASFELGGRRYDFFAHDWRRRDVEAWLELMEQNELADELAGGAPAQAPPALALSQPDFADAVRSALRDLFQPDRLAANPLVRTRVVRDRDNDGAPVAEVLEALLREAVASLQADPRDEKLHRALDRTYIRPAHSQEAAAEILGTPFSTYRRHLARGTERVADWLWQRELYGSGSR